MKKKIDPLDNLVREKLSNLEVPYTPFAWELLEQKMDAAEANAPQAENRLLDAAVFAKLHNMEAGDRPTHWHLLAAKLDENVDVRRKVLIYKVMEIAAVFLLLLLAGQYLTTSFNRTSPVAEKTKIKSELNNPTTSTPTEVECNETLTQIIASTESNTTKTFSGNNKISNQTNNKLKTTADSKINPIIAATEQASSNTPEILIQGYRESPQIGNKPLQKQRSTQEISIVQKGLSGMKPSDLLNPVQPERWDILTSIDELVVSELQYKSPTDYTMLIKQIKKRPNVIVSMFGSADYNHIITPAKYEGDERLEETKRYAPGYGGGITAGLELGRWEVSTGAIYTSKEYQPRQVLYATGATGNLRDGYFIEGIKNIQLNTFNIPLHLRYNFIFHDKWRAYATAGLSLQVAFQADYYIGDGDDFKNQGYFLPTTQREPGFGQDPLDESKLPKGFFEGGSLWENGYITGNIGLGLERYITGRWSIFAQPTYHQALKYFTHGLGPDKDRIHTMSLFTGVRVRLSN